MKKIIILGASVYQVPLIRKAKELGLYTIVISIPGNYLGFSYADKNYFVDTKNKEEILKIAKEEGVKCSPQRGQHEQALKPSPHSMV
jgi:biotin carboxylase